MFGKVGFVLLTAGVVSFFAELVDEFLSVLSSGEVALWASGGSGSVLMVAFATGLVLLLPTTGSGVMGRGIVLFLTSLSGVGSFMVLLAAVAL